jgi:hypothetical protein
MLFLAGIVFCAVIEAKALDCSLFLIKLFNDVCSVPVYHETEGGKRKGRKRKGRKGKGRKKKIKIKKKIKKNKNKNKKKKLRKREMRLMIKSVKSLSRSFKSSLAPRTPSAAKNMSTTTTTTSRNRSKSEKSLLDLSEFTPDLIRNFSIIAHIDHGKSTLADRLLEMTGTIKKSNDTKRYMDKLKVEKERGITVKAQTASMFYDHSDGKRYLLNLVNSFCYSFYICFLKLEFRCSK